VLAVAVALEVIRRSRNSELLPPTYTAPIGGDTETEQAENLQLWQGTEEGARWEKEALDVEVSALEDARDLAAKWGATIGTLLGVFGVVAFASGPSALSDIPGNAAYVVLLLILLATVAAGAAIYKAALAAEASPARLAPFNGWTLKSLYESEVPDVLATLRQSRAFALSAVVLVFGAVTVGWLATLHDRDQTTPVKVLVTFNDGSVSCGEMKRSSKGLTVSGKPLTNVKQIAVSSCPKE
jgi:hypothetical protein